MLRVLLLTAGVGGLAVAAPVPKAAPGPTPRTSASLTLGTATLNGQRLQITYQAPNVGVAGPIAANEVIGKPGVRTTTVLLTAVKVTTADGKELTGDDLTKKLGDSPAVARSLTAIDPEWKKVFADDVLFVEPSGKPAVGVGGVGGGVIRPLPAPIRPGGIRPAVLPPVEEVPVEKKEEKKEPPKEEKK